MSDDEFNIDDRYYNDEFNFDWLRRRLRSSFEAKQLFEHVTGRRPPMLLGPPIYHYDQDLGNMEEEEALRQLIDRRLAGEPLQYLLGEWEFYGLPFKVGPGVLIPRPDTEMLVDTALEKIADKKNPEVLELCSGSGCVAVAVNSERPDARVTAVELSPDAFRYLEENIAHNQSPVVPRLDDLFTYRHPAAIDLLLANPPYIPREDLAGLQREVQYEPPMALDGGEDGLDFYIVIADRYRPQMAPGGVICLEVGIDQSESVQRILDGAGFVGIGVARDLAGIPRVVYGGVV